MAVAAAMHHSSGKVHAANGAPRGQTTASRAEEDTTPCGDRTLRLRGSGWVSRRSPTSAGRRSLALQGWEGAVGGQAVMSKHMCGVADATVPDVKQYVSSGVIVVVSAVMVPALVWLVLQAVASQFLVLCERWRQLWCPQGGQHCHGGDSRLCVRDCRYWNDYAAGVNWGGYVVDIGSYCDSGDSCST